MADQITEPEIIAHLVLDLKPWDETTDLRAMEDKLRQISMDGLVWGNAELIPMPCGYNKLQIVTVIEDNKLTVDELTEKLTVGLRDYVQVVDVKSFNKDIAAM
ncbi:probable elongation factor 1-beta/1-delta 1 [Oppia nitens]|uniref:probable elongation factor 1-beta/1-delta 1 n=1 Tax=Oppia nitens TaxID=1686743 RepID=UPI0023DA0107|nr:probable elongation factor 1-beta/1-delta 1 [Oppia nitens]